MPSVLGISIHAAREGGDFVNHYAKQGYSISIHAAREGGDAGVFDHSNAGTHFNPRRP